MKLYAKIESERGKTVEKTGNDYITLTLTKDRRQKFDITFTGEQLKIMRYSDASEKIVEYIER